jgi:hypothetical protein
MSHANAEELSKKANRIIGIFIAATTAGGGVGIVVFGTNGLTTEGSLAGTAGAY